MAWSWMKQRMDGWMDSADWPFKKVLTSSPYIICFHPSNLAPVAPVATLISMMSLHQCDVTLMHPKPQSEDTQLLLGCSLIPQAQM